MNAYKILHYGTEHSDCVVLLHPDLFSPETFERMVLEASGEAARLATQRARAAYEERLPEFRTEAELDKAEGKWWRYAINLAQIEMPDEPDFYADHLLDPDLGSAGAIGVLIERYGFSRLEYVSEFFVDNRVDGAEDLSGVPLDGSTHAFSEAVRPFFKQEHAEGYGERLHLRTREILVEMGIDPDTARRDYLEAPYFGQRFGAPLSNEEILPDEELLRAFDIEHEAE